MSVENLITAHLDIWTSAIKTRSTAGRGSSKKLDLVGIKKLRELILELAVRGKLVPQDANDVPASELLNNIADARETLLEERRVKYRVVSEHPDIKKLLHPCPKNWIWTKFPEVVFFQEGPGIRNWQFRDAGVKLLNVSNILNDGTLNYDKSDKFVSLEEFEEKYSHFKIEEGDLLYAGSGGSWGKSSWYVNPGYDVMMNTSTLRLRFFSILFSPNYLKYFLDTSCFKNQMIVQLVGIQPNFGSTHFNKIFLPIPPAAEQHRIVAKVDELMVLCDQMEAQTEVSIDAHKTLVEVLLATLTDAKDADELNENWQTISQHFDVLFTTQDAISQLKKTILQLAVMGKLVKQNHKDEPASKLLERIATEKQQLIKDGKIKKQKSLPPITEDEKPFGLPDGWEWVRFGNLVNFKAELVRPEEFYHFDQVAPDSIEKGTGKLLFRRTVEESGIRGPNSRFYKDQIIYSKIRPSLSKVIIAEFDGLCSADMYPLEAMINSQYLLKIMLSEVFLTQVRVAENRIKMPKLNIESLSNILVPLAPISMQTNIVNVVVELTGICDPLQEHLNQAQTIQLHFTDAIVEQGL